MRTRKLSRRDFLKVAAAGAAGLAVAGIGFRRQVGRALEVLAALGPHAPRPLAPAEHARVMSAAHADDLDGMPALYLAGTHYEMGYQHGTLARDRILSFRDAAYAYVTGAAGEQMGWPDWLARLLARPALLWQAAAYRDTIPSEYLEEAQGIADGAGIHVLEVVLVTAIWEIYLVGGCSEFVASGGMTADGSLIHGYNYDLMEPEHALINPHLAMLFYRPSGAVAFSTLNTVGSIGANAGMNDAGLSVAWDNTYTRDDALYAGIDLPVVPFIITLRRLLERCRSLDEAVQLVVTTLPRPLADIILIASAAESQAVALETAGNLHATRPLEGGAVWSANHFRSPELAPYDRAGDWNRLEAADRDWLFPRTASYATLFERHRGRVTPRMALDILRDPYPREAAGERYPLAPGRTICRERTGFSLIMQPGLSLIWGSDGKLPAPQGRFFAFEQNRWRRRQDLDFAASGFRAALACAEAYAHGAMAEASTLLDQALAADGETAPLLLMRAALRLARSDDAGASADMQRVYERWPQSDAAQVAYAWARQLTLDVQPVRFPGATAPRLGFHAVADVERRVQVGIY